MNSTENNEQILEEQINTINEEETVKEEEEKKKLFPLIWLIVLLLFILVLITTILVGHYIKDRAILDKNVIELIPEDLVENEQGSNGQSSEGEITDESTGNGQEASLDEGSSQENDIPMRPGFEGSDLVGLWRNQTTVNIFKDYYNETGGIWTVWSDDGDKVIAPGTGNIYAFQLKNSGNISMDYEMNIISVFDMGEMRAPIEVRLKTADDVYLAGDENTWLTPEQLNEVVTKGTLDVNNYANFRLEWQWPFHPEYASDGWDLNDTMIGNEAFFKDMKFTMTINTTATTTPGAKPVAGFGMGIIPQTGDNSNIFLYMIGLAGVALVLFLLIFVRRRSREKENGHEEQR